MEGARACPPEDCGGPSGYADLLDALNNPDHEQHLEMKQWLSNPGKGPFDPERLDLALTNKVLEWTAQDIRRHAPSRWREYLAEITWVQNDSNKPRRPPKIGVQPVPRAKTNQQDNNLESSY